MRIEENEETTSVIFEENEINVSVKQTYLMLINEISTNPDALSGSFIFDAPNGVKLEVTISRT